MPSSVIRFYVYHADRQELEIGFVSGRRYLYHDVPPELYAAMKAETSKGEFFNLHIRDHFRFTRAE